MPDKVVRIAKGLELLFLTDSKVIRLQEELQAIHVRSRALLDEASRQLKKLTPDGISLMSSVKHLVRVSEESIEKCVLCMASGEHRMARSYYSSASRQLELLKDKCDRLTVAVRNVRRKL